MAFAPPIEVIVVLGVIPMALLVAPMLAAVPARAATRIQPAPTVRTE